MARKRHRATKGSGEIVLRPIRANAGITAAYRKKLLSLIQEMSESYIYWLRASFRANEPEMAMDALPAAELQRAVRRLGIRWQRRFNEAAPELASYFSLSVQKRSDAALQSILKKAGFTVKFKMTREVRDIVRADITENVSLIKSIHSQYHTQVEGLVMRSVQAGRDLSFLTKELQKRYGITKRRAAHIALDQNNKAGAAINRARQIQLGIIEAVWVHSHAGRVPRKTHLANDGSRYDPRFGWHDPDPKVNRRIFPGELINCRCFSRSVVKGFS